MINNLKGAITKCSNVKCNYIAITWHENIENPRPCSKCGSKLEIIASQKN